MRCSKGSVLQFSQCFLLVQRQARLHTEELLWPKASLIGDLAEGQLACAVPKPGRMQGPIDVAKTVYPTQPYLGPWGI